MLRQSFDYRGADPYSNSILGFRVATATSSFLRIDAEHGAHGAAVALGRAVAP